jgi:hypothetical protein
MEVKPLKTPTRRWRRLLLAFLVASLFLLVLAPGA